ncbi:MAG: SURF1 family cytochrome oxidase biogenesis protein [Geminicoccaceae bacterium]
MGLGTWQLQRLSWKEGLIAAAQAQLAQPPRGQAPDASRWTGPTIAITAHGRYLHERSFAFGLAANGNEPGALLVTPFALDDGRVILVDGGWLPERLLPPRVPASQRADADRRHALAAGTRAIS